VEQALNGGFPEPLAGQPVRVVRCLHDACGAETRIRLPAALHGDAVRRVVCNSCRQAYECDGAVEVGVAGRRRARGWLSDPDSPAWKYLSIPVAAAIVVAALFAIQGC
jgi:hypothetical protein